MIKEADKMIDEMSPEELEQAARGEHDGLKIANDAALSALEAARFKFEREIQDCHLQIGRRTDRIAEERGRIAEYERSMAQIDAALTVLHSKEA